MTTEWSALSGIFPIESVLHGWLRMKATESAIYKAGYPENKKSKFVHSRIDQLFSPTGIAGQKLGPIYTPALTADKGATYAKRLCLDLSTLSPYVSGPNSLK